MYLGLFLHGEIMQSSILQLTKYQMTSLTLLSQTSFNLCAPFLYQTSDYPTYCQLLVVPLVLHNCHA